MEENRAPQTACILNPAGHFKAIQKGNNSISHWIRGPHCDTLPETNIAPFPGGHFQVLC